MRNRQIHSRPHSRRKLLEGSLALGLSFGLTAATPLAAAVPTPRQSPGPFYPQRLPEDIDADLTRVEGRAQPAAGEVVEVFGRVTDEAGRALADARVEIWQCDAFGFYHHPRDRGGQADPNFQGYGRMLLGEEGRYRFRTIKPVAYPGRTPHIHFAVSGPIGISRLTTQMYLAGHPLNARDFLYNAISDPAARKSVTVAFAATSGGPPQGRFDIVLGRSLLPG